MKLELEKGVGGLLGEVGGLLGEGQRRRRTKEVGFYV